MRRLSLVIAAGLLAGGCAHQPRWAHGGHHGPVSSFSSISNSGSADVVVSTGRGFAVRVDGSAARVLYRVEGDTLRVDTRGSHHGRAVLHVTMPALAAARSNSSGNIRIDRVVGPVFTASSGGSGDIHVGDLRTAVVRLTSSGSGNVSIGGGATDWLEAATSGSGNIETRGLRARAARLATSGSGNIDAWASDAAELASSGSGNAVVDGGARCRLRSSGSGAARCG